ncbi:leukocyte immunoglobulin-like receptor subfamily A member 3 isoform X2 [Paroedura picta]|uniref:leukocyte immunoglobulin-like receptor subfamily A member 3 isoform X2 n=1 Tax=Paroedura picta TaxID=143630 RepID=UPI00405798BF
MRFSVNIIFLGWWMAGQRVMPRVLPYPKPFISMSSGEVVTQGGNITIHCQNEGSQQAEFSLHKQKGSSLHYLDKKKAEQNGVVFTISNATQSNAGIYRCIYCFNETTLYDRCSDYSDEIHIDVRGEDIPKPSISVSPRDTVNLGGDVYIQCRNAKVAQVEFALLKGRVRLSRTVEFRLLRTAEFHEAVFLLSNIKRTDGGVYHCRYRIRNSPDDQWSPLSDPVHINVTDPTLTKPVIEVSPRGKPALGSNVTIECKSKKDGLTFSLHKSGSPIASQKAESNGNVAKFLLHVRRTEDAGRYSCQYQHSSFPHVWSEPSDPVELVVEGGSLTIILATCAAGLLLILVLFLLAIVWHKRRRKCSRAKAENQPVTVPLKPEAPTDHDGATSGVERAELTCGTDNDGLTYVQLNHQPRKAQEAIVPGDPSASCIYASVAIDGASC